MKTNSVCDAHSARYHCRWTWRAIGIVLCIALTLPPNESALLHAEKSEPSQYQIEAVYLYNFSRFVQWPTRSHDAPSRPFLICVLGKDPFGATLDSIIAGEAVNGQSILARRIARPQEGSDCRILFVSTSEEFHLKDVLAPLDKTSVLTVSDIPRFSQRGGMIQFVLDGGKVHFEVNLKNATDAGLTVSSDLLEVAVTVRRGPVS